MSAGPRDDHAGLHGMVAQGEDAHEGEGDPGGGDEGGEQRGGQDGGVVGRGRPAPLRRERHHRGRHQGIVQPLREGRDDQDQDEEAEFLDADEARGDDAADEAEAADGGLVQERGQGRAPGEAPRAGEEPGLVAEGLDHGGLRDHRSPGGCARSAIGQERRRRIPQAGGAAIDPARAARGRPLAQAVLELEHAAVVGRVDAAEIEGLASLRMGLLDEAPDRQGRARRRPGPGRSRPCRNR